ncbi:AAA family ATPase [Spiroplasma endosymbiont of Polydrusus pterygomalis]|uniref:AAA family ATPase n=1 Tax=Spiroplasma endosymbiont of Polydrusus pterygomalis TaxID=3139327 RepID=UPI003CCAD936
MSINNPFAKRIKQLIKVISANVYEKETVFKLAILALLSGESIFLLGLPGIAKSLISRRIKYALHDGRNFEYLMNRFSTPEEIFGPISIKDLLKGNYVRIIDQYLPAVDIAFLDEIWKAGPSIQNTLLTIINEKIFRNGGGDIKVPLKLLISASNELPESGKGLEALFDRFIIRMIVYGLTNEENFNDMLESVTSLEIKVPLKLQIKTAEYEKWLKELETTVSLSKDTLNFISRFRKTLTEATDGKAYISDRRWKKIAKLIKASAYYNGRKTTDKADLLIIPYCIWDNEEQEQEYTKLFNEAYCQELTYKLKQKQIELESELETLTNNAANIKDSYNQPSIYSNPFSEQIKGIYYRLLWHNDKFPICFISRKDFQVLLRRNKRSHNIQLFYGKGLSQLDGSQKFQLQLKSSSEIINMTNNSIIQIELNDTNGQSQIGNINDQIKDLKQQIANLKVDFQQEYRRLNKTTSIFFDEQFKMLLETAFFDQVAPIPEVKVETESPSSIIAPASPIIIPNVNDSNNDANNK